VRRKRDGYHQHPLSFAAHGYVALNLPALGEEGIGIFYSIVAAICLVVAFRDPRPKPHRTAVTFRVSPDGVQVDSDTFRASDIRGCRMENLYNQVFGSGLLGGIGNSRTQSMRRVAFYLEVQAGSLKRVLAGGLNEATANELLTEMNAILGSKAV